MVRYHLSSYGRFTVGCPALFWVGYAAAVFLCSFLTVWLIARIRFLRKTVM